MENFKSFRGKMAVPFLPGYTAVTGPNGTGKSNISDAILFVLGPRSSRAIRAGRLTDLIWDGGKEKKGANAMEVSLVFDNRDRTIPIETDEVTLTRYVSRSPSVKDGYNSYFYINGRRSSLDEFTNLLAHARISADGYNVVQQGDVSRIVGMSNVDRRRILENIAGITKFDSDIADAEKKRVATEENIGRIQIIVDEIKKQLKQLSSDREGALKYRELKELLDTAKAQLAYKNREVIQEAIAGTREQVAKYEAERAKLLADKEALVERLDASTAKLEDTEAKIAERGGEEARKVKEKLDALRIERARASDGIETGTESIRNLKKEADSVRRERAKQVRELDALAKEQDRVERKLKELESARTDVEAQLKEVDGLASRSDSRILQIQKEIVALNKDIDGHEEPYRGLVLEGDRAGETAERLTAEVGRLEEVRKSYEFELKDLDWQLKEIRTSSKKEGKSTKKLQQEFEAKRKEEAELARQRVELQNAIESLAREHSRLRAESEVADAVRKGYSVAVAAILEARDTDAIPGIHGTVAELGRIDSKYETAIEVAAGNRMQAIVVDDDSVAAMCIDHLKKRKSGRATFLPLNKMLAARPRGKAVLVAKEGIGFAIDLISFDEKYRNAFAYVFGDTVVVKSLDEARKHMGGIRIVTPDGELIESSGAMIGGDPGRSALKFGAPSPGEVQKVAEQLRVATTEAKKVQERLESLRKELVDLESRLKDVGGQTATADAQGDALEAKRKEFVARLDAIDKDLKAVRGKLGDARTTADRVRTDLERLDATLKELKSKRESLKKAVVDATPQEISSRMKALMNDRTKVVDELASVRSHSESLATQRKVFEDRRDEFDARLENLEAQRSEHEAQVKDCRSRLERFETEVRGLEKMETSLSKEMKDLQEARDAAYRERTQLEGEVDKLAHRLETKEDFHLGLQSELKVQEDKLAEAEAELAQLKVEVRGKLPTLDELKRTIAESEVQIAALGNINMRALDDYDAQQRRHDELQQEVGQLTTQRDDLVRLVDELDEKRKDGLRKIFTAINENFRRVFAELSEGGEAELVLENEEEPFEGGLLIKAKPPQKKALRLESLSGGEKSLVSMAFIFALQEYDPSPFYLLDEVDQNLDAVNAEKVSRMIKRNSGTAQFVQVSLRKVTLKDADHIMGVTMQSGGASDVVMDVNLSEVPDEKPQEEAVA